MSNNIFNDDFVAFINALELSKVRYVLVGGYSVILHGYNRTTGDLDLWVEPTHNNYKKLKQAFQIFGLPIEALPIQDFLNVEEMDVFTFGRPPVSIDIMTAVKGLDFKETYESSSSHKIDDTKVRVISLPQLRRAKQASGRNKDLDDLENLSLE